MEDTQPLVNNDYTPKTHGMPADYSGWPLIILPIFLGLALFAFYASQSLGPAL